MSATSRRSPEAQTWMPGTPRRSAVVSADITKTPRRSTGASSWVTGTPRRSVGTPRRSVGTPRRMPGASGRSGVPMQWSPGRLNFWNEPQKEKTRWQSKRGLEPNKSTVSALFDRVNLSFSPRPPRKKRKKHRSDEGDPILDALRKENERENKASGKEYWNNLMNKYGDELTQDAKNAATSKNDASENETTKQAESAVQHSHSVIASKSTSSSSSSAPYVRPVSSSLPLSSARCSIKPPASTENCAQASNIVVPKVKKENTNVTELLPPGRPLKSERQTPFSAGVQHSDGSRDDSAKPAPPEGKNDHATGLLMSQKPTESEASSSTAPPPDEVDIRNAPSTTALVVKTSSQANFDDFDDDFDALLWHESEYDAPLPQKASDKPVEKQNECEEEDADQIATSVLKRRRRTALPPVEETPKKKAKAKAKTKVKAKAKAKEKEKEKTKEEETVAGLKVEEEDNPQVRKTAAKAKAKVTAKAKVKAKATAKATPKAKAKATKDKDEKKTTVKGERKEQTTKLKKTLASSNFVVSKASVQRRMQSSANRHIAGVKRDMANKLKDKVLGEKRRAKNMIIERREALIRESKGHKYLSVNSPGWDVPMFSEGCKHPAVAPPQTPLEALKVCGFSTFRPGQMEAVTSVLEKKSTLVLLTTGMGKSLCYQIPALMLRNEGICVVVTPLVALMADQLLRLPKAVRGGAISSHQSSDQSYKVLQAAREGKLDVLFVTPERLALWGSGSRLGFNISMACVDEAHCISSWSHNFRPAYMRIKRFLLNLNVSRVMGLTATATAKTLESVKEVLSIERTITSMGIDAPVYDSVNRSNLTISAKFFEDVSTKLNYLATILKETELRGPKINGSVIVYCWKKRTVDEVSRGLNQRGLRTRPYHGDLTAEIRDEVQKEFMSDKVRIVVATIAFGMGIDKPDIRGIVHYDMPKSLENYVQEIGRCARNRQFTGACKVFVAEDDFLGLRQLGTGTTSGHGGAVKRLLEKLWPAQGESKKTVFVCEKEFSREIECAPDEVHSLLVQLELQNAIDLYACVPGKSRLRFFGRREEDIALEDPFMSKVLSVAKRFGEAYSLDTLKALEETNISAPDFFTELTRWGQQAGFTVERERYGFVVECHAQTAEDVTSLEVTLRNHVLRVETSSVSQIDSAYIAFRLASEGDRRLEDLLDIYFESSEGVDVAELMAGTADVKKRILGKYAENLNENWEDHPDLGALANQLKEYVKRLQIDCPVQTKRPGDESALKYANILLGRASALLESYDERRRYMNFTAWKVVQNRPFGLVLCAVRKVMLELTLEKFLRK